MSKIKLTSQVDWVLPLANGWTWWTSLKTVNWNSLVWSWDIVISWWWGNIKQFIAWEDITIQRALYLWEDWKVYNTSSAKWKYLWISNETKLVNELINVTISWTYIWTWFTVWSKYLNWNTWSSKATMTTARSWLTSNIYNWVIYCIGWYTSVVVWTNEAYDIATNTWSSKATMTTARHSLTSQIYNWVIYCIGWYTSVVVWTNEAYDIWVSSIIVNTWILKVWIAISSTELILSNNIL